MTVIVIYRQSRGKTSTQNLLGQKRGGNRARSRVAHVGKKRILDKKRKYKTPIVAKKAKESKVLWRPIHPKTTCRRC
jgi:hypothetical protein